LKNLLASKLKICLIVIPSYNINEKSLSWGLDKIINIIDLIYSLNENLFFFINSHLQNGFFNFTMPIITNLGSEFCGVAICLIIWVFAMIKKNEQLRKLAVIGIIALCLVSIIVSIIKFSVAEPRPFVTLKNVHLLETEIDPFSFPSGHTTNAFALTIVFGLNRKISIFKKPLKLIWFLIPLAAIVGFSRIYIGVHYPLDVLVGAIIGIILGLIAIKLGNTFLKIKKTKSGNDYH